MDTQPGCPPSYLFSVTKADPHTPVQRDLPQILLPLTGSAWS